MQPLLFRRFLKKTNVEIWLFTHPLKGCQAPNEPHPLPEQLSLQDAFAGHQQVLAGLGPRQGKP